MATIRDTHRTAPDAPPREDRRGTADALLLAAAGTSGRLVAAELVARGLSVQLAGRTRRPLEDLAGALPTEGAVSVDVRNVDIDDPSSLAGAIAGVGVVVSTIGPFTRRAGAVIDACLAADTSYVDIANEWSAVKSLLDRQEEARARRVALVTGAGFGPTATETLVLRLVAQMSAAPARVRVAAAPTVAHRGDAVHRTIEESLAQGAITYRDGQVLREPLGSGATVLTFGGASRRMLPAPVGDLEAARRATGAPNVVAYITHPSAPTTGSRSCAWAEILTSGGHRLEAELVTG